MKAAIMRAYGTPDVLSVEKINTPTPSDHEVLIKILSSTVTRADTMMMTGKPYIGRLFLGLSKPKNPIPGTGYAGVVEAVGKEVEGFFVGEEVFGETTTAMGANAEYLVVSPESVLLHKPESISFEEAATYGDGLVTSYNFLHKIVDVKPGQKVLINGASGSLGTAAIQLAKYFGAEVTAVCSTKNVELVKSLGAHHVIDYKVKDFTKDFEKYDVIFDTIGASSFRASKRVLKKQGVYLSPVLNLGILIQSIRSSFVKGKVARFAATGMKKDFELREMMEEILKIYHSGGIKSIIDKRFSLDNIGMAYHYVSKGHKVGNVVIINE